MKDEDSGLDSVIYILKSQKESLNVKFDVAIKAFDVISQYIKGIEKSDIKTNNMLSNA